MKILTVNGFLNIFLILILPFEEQFFTNDIMEPNWFVFVNDRKPRGFLWSPFWIVWSCTVYTVQQNPAHDLVNWTLQIDAILKICK